MCGICQHLENRESEMCCTNFDSDRDEVFTVIMAIQSQLRSDFI